MLNVVQAAPGESVMIIDLGGVGMAALITAIGEAAGEVIAVDPMPDKHALARARCDARLHPR